MGPGGDTFVIVAEESVAIPAGATFFDRFVLMADNEIACLGFHELALFYFAKSIRVSFNFMNTRTMFVWDRRLVP